MREFIDGNTAIVRGALAAGCDFFAGYPITPATPIQLDLMRELPRMGGVAIQGEDEIASLFRDKKPKQISLTNFMS